MPTLNGGEISITPSPRTKSIGMLCLVDWGGGGGGEREREREKENVNYIKRAERCRQNATYIDCHVENIFHNDFLLVL